jgi:hypothetical protein
MTLLSYIEDEIRVERKLQVEHRKIIRWAMPSVRQADMRHLMTSKAIRNRVRLSVTFSYSGLVYFWCERYIFPIGLACFYTPKTSISSRSQQMSPATESNNEVPICGRTWPRSATSTSPASGTYPEMPAAAKGETRY